MAYEILAELPAKYTDSGYCVYDWFTGQGHDNNPLDKDFETHEEAAQAAKAAYLGPDVDGVEPVWVIAEIKDHG